jgi:hypothetical protein
LATLPVPLPASTLYVSPLRDLCFNFVALFYSTVAITLLTDIDIQEGKAEVIANEEGGLFLFFSSLSFGKSIS